MVMVYRVKHNGKYWDSNRMKNGIIGAQETGIENVMRPDCYCPNCGSDTWTSDDFWKNGNQECGICGLRLIWKGNEYEIDYDYQMLKAKF